MKSAPLPVGTVDLFGGSSGRDLCSHETLCRVGDCIQVDSEHLLECQVCSRLSLLLKNEMIRQVDKDSSKKCNYMRSMHCREFLIDH